MCGIVGVAGNVRIGRESLVTMRDAMARVSLKYVFKVFEYVKPRIGLTA